MNGNFRSSAATINHRLCVATVGGGTTINKLFWFVSLRPRLCIALFEASVWPDLVPEYKKGSEPRKQEVSAAALVRFFRRLVGRSSMEMGRWAGPVRGFAKKSCESCLWAWSDASHPDMSVDCRLQRYYNNHIEYQHDCHLNLLLLLFFSVLTDGELCLRLFGMRLGRAAYACAPEPDNRRAEQSCDEAVTSERAGDFCRQISRSFSDKSVRLFVKVSILYCFVLGLSGVPRKCFESTDTLQSRTL